MAKDAMDKLLENNEMKRGSEVNTVKNSGH